MSPRRLILLVSALALVVAACGTSAPSASPSGAICGTAPDSAAAATWGGTASPAPTLTPVLVSNAITCGKARILFLYLDSQNRVASAPDRKATVAFYNLGRDPNKAVVTAEGEFVWTIKDERGMYVVNVDLPEAGTWGAEFTTSATDAAGVETGEQARMTFSVLDAPTAIAVGQKAPASKTPTVAMSAATSARSRPTRRPTPPSIRPRSPTPWPPTSHSCSSSRRRSSVRRPAVRTNTRPFKPVAAANPDVTFINVEPYKLQDVDGQLQPVLDPNEQTPSSPPT